jgi:hypothetical protein
LEKKEGATMTCSAVTDGIIVKRPIVVASTKNTPVFVVFIDN